MNANEKDFDAKLKELGSLYEEGKDHLRNILPLRGFGDDFPSYERLFSILKEMRDIAALAMKSQHDISDN